MHGKGNELTFRTSSEFAELQLKHLIFFLGKQICSGANEIQIATKLQNATNQNNFPSWNDTLNSRSPFAEI